MWCGEVSGAAAVPAGESGESSPVTTSPPPLPFLHPIAASRPHPRSANLLTLSQQPRAVLCLGLYLSPFLQHMPRFLHTANWDATWLSQASHNVRVLADLLKFMFVMFLVHVFLHKDLFSEIYNRLWRQLDCVIV